MDSKTKSFFDDTWVGVILSILIWFCYFIFIGSCFVFGIITLIRELKIDLLPDKMLSHETSAFLIKALAAILGIFLTAATMMGTKLLIKKLKS